MHLLRTLGTVMQIFTYFEHMQIVLKLEPTKILRDYEISRFFFTQQIFMFHGAPDVDLVNILASYHRLDGERNMQHDSKSSN